jgi:hypothetical protein
LPSSREGGAGRQLRKFYESLTLADLTRKPDYHTLASYVPAEALDGELREKLDAIVAVAERARPRGAGA